MSVNKYEPHVWVIPEDDKNRQLVGGFIRHDAVADKAMQVRAPAGGWRKVLDVFECEYVSLLRRYPCAHVVMLIDFDESEDRRAKEVDPRIPDDVKSRVFVVGSKDEPETLYVELKMKSEEIGRALAEDCLKDDFKLWSHPHLIHNKAELQRLVNVVKPFLFSATRWTNR